MDIPPEIVEIPDISNILGNNETITKNEEKTGSKTAAITIFVIIGIFLVGYIIYMYEAYRNHFFPFPKFQFTPDNMPPNSVLALGKVTEEPVVDDSNRAELEAVIQGVLASNATWYNTKGTGAITLPQPVLGSST